jgi:uncharacterized protein
MSVSVPCVHNVLIYEYVNDMLERRVPYREAHLERVAAERAAGRVVMAGAIGDPPNGALIVFSEAAGPEAAEAFAAGDPYVEAGLVTARRVEPWAVV